jgi:hypothetical protein
LKGRLSEVLLDIQYHEMEDVEDHTVCLIIGITGSKGVTAIGK